ncbi:cytochrome b/b6 domain-containing protein [Hyphomicrobium sp.]|uniref:cytochrome b/b6 domain-containing protein n=1 Tax=Hyphomicrobium sp. TaxID=82 RepID=UPI003F6FD8F1
MPDPVLPRSTISGRAARVPAWDLPTRLFHWTLLGLVVSAWATSEFAESLGDETLVLHRANGLALLTLLVWRMLWGVFGSSTARFATFVGGPRRIVAYARGLITGRSPAYLGHNPLGALMVVALLASLLAIATLGLFATDDNDLAGGPLYRLVGEAANARAAGLHDRIFHVVLLPLAALHVAANTLYTLVKKEPLIQAMIRGTKPAADYADAASVEIPSAPGLRALACLAAAAVIVLGGILALGGNLTLK